MPGNRFFLKKISAQKPQKFLFWGFFCVSFPDILYWSANVGWFSPWRAQGDWGVGTEPPPSPVLNSPLRGRRCLPFPSEGSRAEDVNVSLPALGRFFLVDLPANISSGVPGHSPHPIGRRHGAAARSRPGGPAPTVTG